MKNQSNTKRSVCCGILFAYFKSLVCLALLGLSCSAYTAELKIGIVNIDRILRDATPSVRAQKKLEKDFEKRDRELQQLRQRIQSMQDEFEKNSVTMGDSERRTKERDFSDLNRDFQRRQREYNEDINQRRNEEVALIIDRANKIIKQIAEAESYDLILQDAVYLSPKIDITDKVIKGLESSGIK